MRKIPNPLHYIFEHELQSLYLFAPVFFAMGVATYFQLHNEPNFIYSIIAFAIAALLLLAAVISKRFFIPVLFITFIISGFFFANLRAVNSRSITIQPELGTVWVRGDVVNLDRKDKSSQILLKNLDLWQPEGGQFASSETPKKIRISVRTKISASISTGDRISFKALLSPPAENPAYPGGYDFNRLAYFRQIGGIGYAISNIELFEKKKESWVDRFQDYYYKKTNENIHDHDISGIIVSQITADKVEISDDTYQSMRQAGLGHLIAISGMNMSVAMVWIFILTRAILSYFPRLTLHHNIKKISCISAMFFGLLYLLVTGMPVSAVRAFLMVMLFFTAVLTDRISVSLHPVAFAAMIILIFTPENLVAPGFQLSFAAVIGLIGMYELFDTYMKKYFAFEHSFITKWLLAFCGIIITTFCTSITTAPFGILHFGTFSNYGIIANMIGVPVASIIVLPFAFLSILAMPLGIEKPFLEIAAFGARIIRDVSYFIANKPNSVTYLADIPNQFIIYITAGFLILFIFKTKIRFIGIPLIIFGYYLIMQKPEMPDFVINESGSLIALKQDDGSYQYFGTKRQSFSLYQFNSKLGVKEPVFIKTSDECSRKRCVYKNILFGNALDVNDCEKSDYLINLGKTTFTCNKTKVIDKAHLKETGAELFFLDKNLITTANTGRSRLWNQN